MSRQGGLSAAQRTAKRAMDVAGSATGLALTWPVIVVAYVAASIDTRSNGLFLQRRVGMHGREFTVLKIRTMRQVEGLDTTVTQRGDPRITSLGAFFRRTKIDELPQLLNVLVGQMSFVGPRPDVRGYADRLTGEQRLLLSVRPGITGPATLAFRNEEELLSERDDPIKYNDEVIYPEKVRINLEYVRNWRLRDDVKYIVRTLFGG